MTSTDSTSTPGNSLASAHAAWFDAVVRADWENVQDRCEALAHGLAADPSSADAWAGLPAAQWAAEQAGLTGYASLYNAALPAELASVVTDARPDGMPDAVPGAWAARLDPDVTAEQRAAIDRSLDQALADRRADLGLTVPQADPAPQNATIFPPGFMAALTRLRRAALSVPPRTPGTAHADAEPGTEPDGDAAPRPARALEDLLDALVEHEDLEWRRPVTQKQADRLEAFLGAALPADYRAFLDRANGSTDREFAGAHEAAADARELLGYFEEQIEDADDPEAERARFVNDDGSGRVAPGGFVRGWLPIYDHGTGAFVILDCAPGPAGHVGQILEYDDGQARLTHPDFRAWLQDHVDDLEP